MKNLIHSILTCIVLVTGVTLHAQLLPKENALLWEVSGKDLKTPSYVYGTIHMICEKDFLMKDKVLKALEKTTTLALEVNTSDPNEMALIQQSAMGRAKLSTTLTAQQQKDLTEILRKSKLTLQQLDNYKLTTVMSILTIQSFGCSNYKMYEMEFITKAKQKNMPVIGLETAQEQIDIFNNMFTNNELISYLKTISVPETQKIVASYVNEDINTIYNTSIAVMNKKNKAVMLDNRNWNWIKKMPGLMSKGSVFFAVGAAHLPGDTGIIYLLRKAGYTVKPVMQ